MIEGLEERVVLSTIQWNIAVAPTGGSWDVGNNWDGGKIPGASDTAVINKLTGSGLVYLDSQAADTVLSLTTDSTTTVKVDDGSLTLGVGDSTIGGPVEVVSGAKLSVATGASVQINNGQTITVDAGGTLNTGAATVTQQEDNNGATEGILVNGTMTATGTNFPGGPYDNSRIEVGANGSLTASNSTFAWNYFELDNGSKVATGNLTGNIFNTTVYAPATDVQYLGNNASFQAIDLLAGSLSSGQSVSLGLIGTGSHANLKYLFTGAFEVQSGATLSFANGASVQINNGQTITVDAGGR